MFLFFERFRLHFSMHFNFNLEWPRIKDNAKYHSGRNVTSIDIKYSWERALKSQNNKNVLNYLGDIVGATEFSSGKINNLAFM